MREGRTQRLKQRLLEAPFEVCAERAVLWTESQRRTQGQPQVVRNARALEHLLASMTICIRPEELVVGNRASKLRGAPLFPETKSFSIAAQLASYESRAIQPFRVGEAEKAALRQILPYWQGRSAWDRAFQLMPPEVQAEVFKFIFTVEAEFANGIGHFIVGNPNLLAKGFRGVREEAEANLRASAGMNGDRRRDFWSAAIIAADAAIAFAGRFASEAGRLAGRESDPERRAELEEIAAVCDRVPADPPRTFREAIQAVWFHQLLCQLECGGFAISPGRLDQLLYPFYRRDREQGRINQEQAQELIECLFVKMSEVVNVLDTVILPVTSGPPIAQSLTIAGTDRDGRDSTQELSYLFLEALDHLRTVSPNLAVRFHPGTPAEFLHRVGDAVRRGAMMALFNDQVIVPALMQKGIPELAARDYAVVGCVEPAAPGQTFGSTDSNLVNLARCLELALGNGNGRDLIADRREMASRLNSYFRVRKNRGASDSRGELDCSPPFASERRVGSRRASRAHQLMLLKYLLAMRRRTRVRLRDLYRILRGQALGPRTGDARGFSSFDQVLDAFRQQVAYAVERMVAAMHFCDQAHAELKPTPFLSSTIDDCMAQGLDVTEGGARYNFTGPQAVGLADVADSLAAIKRLVFEQKKITLPELLAALRRNFEGEEPLRQMLLNQAPKFGNDAEEVDALARAAAAIYCQEVSRHQNFRGGPYSPGIYSLSAHIVFGILTGATPDGRKAGESLAAGVSPARGRERGGPTAVLRSAAHLDAIAVSNGWVLNLSLDPKLLEGEKNLEKFIALNRAYFELGGLHVQYNVVDAETLQEAQRDPERHRGLVVRVAGYSALFTELDRATQEDIIARTRHGCEA